MGFESELKKAVRNLGGWFNAHAHIDRAFVMEGDRMIKLKRCRHCGRFMDLKLDGVTWTCSGCGYEEKN